jgi:hypothetical protein
MDENQQAEVSLLQLGQAAVTGRNAAGGGAT